MTLPMTFYKKSRPSTNRIAEPTTPTPTPEPGTSLSDIQELQLHWLWDKRILHGKLTLLNSDPDLGKSLITLDLAARTGSLAYSQGLERLVQRSRVLLLRALKEHIFKQVREVLLLLRFMNYRRFKLIQPC